VVVAFSVTTRTKRFKPRLFRNHIISADGVTLEVKLGHSSFDQLAYEPQEVGGGLAARRFQYYEIYYYGNPGNYLHFAYSLSDAGYFTPKDVALVQHLETWRTSSGERAYKDVSGFLGDPKTRRARTLARPNTLTVSTVDPRELPSLPRGLARLGPDLDYVRLTQMDHARNARRWSQALAAAFYRIVAMLHLDD
jgi:hypothetical protein